MLYEMKFKVGDATDAALCVALQHEFLRCDDAFNEFASSAKTMITQGESRRVAYTTYNAYARFIHHLYEFMIGAATRDRSDTAQLSPELAERYIAGHTQRILTNKREAILNGRAPVWENHISAYPEKIPETFASEFRKYRNIVSGHVKFQRANLSLSEFFDRYHMYVYMLYRDAQSWWGRMNDGFPDLKEITAFSVLVRKTPSP